MTTTDQLKTPEACAYLNVSKGTLYNLFRRGVVKRTKRGRLVRWPKQDLDRYIQRHTKGATAVAAG